MTLASELHALHERLAALETGPAVVGDWHRFEARVARTLILAMNLCACEAELAELRRLRLCAQIHLLDFAA